MGIASLEIGRKALLANSFGMDVVSNNIANVNTAGFSRRDAVSSEDTTYYSQGNFNGTGSIIDKLRTFREDFFDKEVRNSISRQSTYDIDNQTMDRVATVLNEPSENGLSEVTSKFLNAFDELALKPEDVAQRQNVVSLAQTMVDRFNATAQQLSDSKTEIQNNLKNNIDKANTLINDIAGLNKAFSGNKPLAASDAQTVIDQREGKIEELAKLFNTNVVSNKDGSVNVYLSGINVVTGQVSSKLAVTESTNAITGEQTDKIVKLDKDNNVLSTINPESGEVASQLKHFNVTLDGQDSSGGFSVVTQLNRFVGSLVNKINSLATGGYGLDDTGNNPPGTQIFNPTVGVADAQTIKLNPNLIADPRKLPISDKAGESGNSNIARAIARLTSDTTFLDNATPSQFYSQLLGKIGNSSQAATQGLATTKSVATQLANQRESIIGVNQDEEAVNLIKFQQAFQASSRVINTTNEILTTIVNLGK